MEDDHIFALLFRFLAERRASLTEYTMSGRPQTLEDYTKAVAQYEAYTAVEEEMKELEKRFMDQ